MGARFETSIVASVVVHRSIEPLRFEVPVTTLCFEPKA